MTIKDATEEEKSPSLKMVNLKAHEYTGTAMVRAALKRTK